jgi:hypothetical protein
MATSNFAVRFPEGSTLADDLRATAQREGRPVNDVVLEAIEQYVSARNLRREEHVTCILREDADLLTDLA